MSHGSLVHITPGAATVPASLSQSIGEQLVRPEELIQALTEDEERELRRIRNMLGKEFDDFAAFKTEDIEDEHAREMWRQMVHTEGEFSRPRDDMSMILKGGRPFASVNVDGVYRMNNEQDKGVVVAPGSTIWAFFPTQRTDANTVENTGEETSQTTEDMQRRSPAIRQGADGPDDEDPGDHRDRKLMTWSQRRWPETLGNLPKRSWKSTG